MNADLFGDVSASIRRLRNVASARSLTIRAIKVSRMTLRYITDWLFAAGVTPIHRHRHWRRLNPHHFKEALRLPTTPMSTRAISASDNMQLLFIDSITFKYGIGYAGIRAIAVVIVV